MAVPNTAGIWAWDNDAAPWTTITVDVELRFNYNVDNGPQIDPGVDDSYKTQWKGSGTKNFDTLTFSREDPAFDDFVQSDNAFALIMGSGIETSPGNYDAAKLLPDYSGLPAEGWQTRRLFCKVAGSEGVGNFSTTDGAWTSAPFTNSDPESMDVPWEINYIRVGPDTGVPIPTDESGTATGDVFFQLRLDQILNNLIWEATCFFPEDIPSFVIETWGITYPSGGAADPVQVFVHNLKTDPGDDVDCGALIEWVAEEPDGSLFNVAEWDVGVTIQVTCS